MLEYFSIKKTKQLIKIENNYNKNKKLLFSFFFCVRRIRHFYKNLTKHTGRLFIYLT